MAEYEDDTGFEKFMTPLNDRHLAFAIPAAGNHGEVRVVDAKTLDLRYEIDLSHTPSEGVVLDGSHWALVLRPFREDPQAEGRVVVVETETGKITREIPLGFSGWQDAYVASADGVLLSCARYGGGGSGGSGMWVLGCWERVSCSPGG